MIMISSDRNSIKCQQIAIYAYIQLWGQWAPMNADERQNAPLYSNFCVFWNEWFFVSTVTLRFVNVGMCVALLSSGAVCITRGSIIYWIYTSVWIWYDYNHEVFSNGINISVKKTPKNKLLMERSTCRPLPL